ncbi:MAG: type II secretion system minor pseudopilin GspK [Sphingomonas sp.]|uniref:type II secretion system minor pseudopilin GspK n=1 Tax=Sphingomonas sp. TaxID=28214 RepID=UPI001AC6F8B5|nr:type II secretion system minor pseudopilin GspK [Sphingomonas sp.]MBN8807716.1 type II secretion system minor pseudopilin GspK [Sphingomonas sp.]
MRADRPGERGAALLTVLLLVAVVGAVAAATLERLNLATRQGANAVSMAQARAWADAAGTMALVKIDTVLKQNPSRVSLAGGWSDTPFPLPIPDGIATARVRDAGNCFNLNSLVTVDPNGNYVTRPAAVMQFARLLTLIGVPGSDGIAAATADWIDSDGSPNPGGAEDAVYAGRTPAYRTANTMMVDASEIRAVAGVTPDAYTRLRRYVCALPNTDPAPINVNTIEPERAALIAAMAPGGVSIDQVRQALAARPPLGWSSAGEFWSRGPLASANAGDAAATTSVTTKWFRVTSDVSLGRIALRQIALVDARRLPTRIVRRVWSDGE